mgnify:CR=1 FL=1
MLDNVLERRKIELKLEEYVKPSKETIDKIFDLFHPTFRADLQKAVSSINWKRDV